jgi:hypothetical protein
MIQFSENIEPKKILKLLNRSIPYYLKAWQEQENKTGFFGKTNPSVFNMNELSTSSPVIEYVIRPHVNILCILASYIYRSDDITFETELKNEQITEYLEKGISWLCDTHITGSSDVDSFLERKRWGENWRSGLWASLMGLCIFLAEDMLDKKTKNRVKRVISFEADRFIDVMPPSGSPNDTKLEENAQDTTVIAWAINLMPDSPNIEEWKSSLNLWAINIASSIKEKADHSRYLNKSVSHWTVTQTLYPDFTADNHAYFNPEILTYGMWIVLAMTAYKVHDNHVPEVFLRKVHKKTFDILLRFCLPNGMIYLPSTSDIPYFIPHPFALAWGLWSSDPRANQITKIILNWIDNVCIPETDSEVPWIPGFKAHYEGWELFFQSQVGFELSLLSTIPFEKNFRYYTLAQIDKDLNTNHIFPYIQVCYRRNTRTTRSVAWKTSDYHPAIGLNIHSYPELLIQYQASMLGIPATDIPIKQWDVAFHYEHIKKSGFDTYGRINYYMESKELLLHRDIRVIIWGDEGILVFDRLFADAEFFLYDQYLSPCYFVNDVWTRKSLELISGSLRETIIAEKIISRDIHCPSFWVSIERSFLLQLIWGRSNGLTYVHGNEANAPRYWKNCRLDMLGVFIDEMNCEKDDIIYQVGFYAGIGKNPRPFKTAGTCGPFFKGVVVMDGKYTLGLD